MFQNMKRFKGYKHFYKAMCDKGTVSQETWFIACFIYLIGEKEPPSSQKCLIPGTHCPV